jgi:hypothetical protein
MNYRYRGFYIKIGFHLCRRVCVDGGEAVCLQDCGKQYNYDCVLSKMGNGPIVRERIL